MNFRERKEKLVDEFNRNQQVIADLSKRQQQIVGGIQVIDNMEKEETAGKAGEEGVKGSTKGKQK